ncbi:MAG TPA: OstA-like protein [Prolixibacteraceae bacterium]
MKNNKSEKSALFPLILLVAIVSIFIQAIQPQEKKKKQRIDIDNADLIVHDEKIIANADRLIGNVSFRRDGALMFCDSAYHYTDSEKFDTFGHVHIIQGDTLHLYGDKMFYDGAIKLAKFVNHVKLVDKSITLTTEALDFDLKSNIGYYNNGGKIVDTANVLTSTIGRYYSNDNMLFFKDSVVLTNKDFVLRADTLKYNSKTERAFIVGPTTIKGTKKDGVLYSENGWYDTKKNVAELYKASKITNKSQVLEADTLFYDRASGNGRGKHRVTLTDTTNKVVIKGKVGVYNEISKIAFVTDSAMFIQYGKKDTMYMHADTLRTKPDTSDINRKDDKFFMAYRKVRFHKPDLQGQCDSLGYRMKDSTMLMFYDPTLWSERNQMTAEKIQYVAKNPDPDIARLENNAFIVMVEDSVKFNQISGKSIIGQIFDNKLRVADVNGNAQTIYYLKDKNKYSGLNRLLSSKIKLHLTENKIDSIRFYPKPEGKTIPIKELKAEDIRLDGFQWRDSERPVNQYDLYPIDIKRKKNAGPLKKPASNKNPAL